MTRTKNYVLLACVGYATLAFGHAQAQTDDAPATPARANSGGLTDIVVTA